jgi:hypothetical protein
MRLDWMMLANYAEAPPGGGLVYIAGGSWDTITVTGGEDLPEGVVAVVQGYLAVRILLHPTELGRARTFDVKVVDEDGEEIAQVEGGFETEAADDLPPGWHQGFNLVFPLNGLPLPRFGLYAINFLLDGQHLGEREFRVVRGL